MNKNAKLKQITFLRCRTIGDKGLAELGPALCGCNAMSVRVVDCGVSDLGGVYLSSIIRAHGARRDERIWSAGLRGEAVKAHSKECPKDIPADGALVVDFSCNRLGDNSAHIISEALKNDTWLLGLNLGGNEISSKGAEDLLKGISTNKTVRALVLASNSGIDTSIESDIASVITEVASTPPPPAAGEELVMKAMRNWSKWKKMEDERGEKLSIPKSPKRGVAGEGKENAAKDKEVRKTQVGKGEDKKTITLPVKSAASAKSAPTKSVPVKSATAKSATAQSATATKPKTVANATAETPTSSSSPSSTVASRKALVKSYLSLARPFVTSNKSSVAAFNMAMKKLWKSVEKKNSGVKELKTLVAMRKSPPDCLNVLKLTLLVIGGKAGKGMGCIGANMSDIGTILSSPDNVANVKSGLKIGHVVFGMASEAVRRKVNDFTEEGRDAVVERVRKKSAFAAILAEAIFEAEILWEGMAGESKGEVELKAAEVKKAFKGVKGGVPGIVKLGVKGDETRGKIEVAVKIPKVERKVENKVDKKKEKRKQEDKEMLGKLENMVDKITDEITKLEGKIEIKGGGSAEKTKGKR
eukprot:CAMPEP_0118656548 /NCGR_PEP_ID=MMETSP0785-20121206/13546_1 /TAXON_ID=91992 /ORGANISM="Bolidomonas pacifica, Strain CCMP 1866" /LENGTH=584 /DNA_ID=CAMNT_0006549411 /DNA_START=152 /DNA_END=1903 /DNA_ORIENTATION=-